MNCKVTIQKEKSLSYVPFRANTNSSLIYFHIIWHLQEVTKENFITPDEVKSYPHKSLKSHCAWSYPMSLLCLSLPKFLATISLSDSLLPFLPHGEKFSLFFFSSWGLYLHSVLGLAEQRWQTYKSPFYTMRKVEAIHASIFIKMYFPNIWAFQPC